MKLNNNGTVNCSLKKKRKNQKNLIYVKSGSNQATKQNFLKPLNMKMLQFKIIWRTCLPTTTTTMHCEKIIRNENTKWAKSDKVKADSFAAHSKEVLTPYDPAPETNIIAEADYLKALS